MSWLLWADVVAILMFGLGSFCLLEPARVVAVTRERWDRSRQVFWGTPAFLDVVEVRFVGAFAVIVALLIADVLLFYS